MAFTIGACFSSWKQFCRRPFSQNRFQASDQDDCLLYKLANYKGGGELVDAYNIGGSIEVEALVREQFGVFMYNQGKGKVVTKTDYLKWFCRHKEAVRELFLWIVSLALGQKSY